jgi:hypothetical protein
VDVLLRRLARLGFRRTMAGSHWSWTLLAVSAWVLRRAMAADRTLLKEVVEPGQRLEVRVLDPEDAATDRD